MSSSALPTPARQRLTFLDALRGVAALVVVVGHVVEHQSSSYLDASLRSVNLGRIGVVAFFLVSGYVISLSLEHQDQRTFWIRRFWRLYPAYWVATALYLVVELGQTTFSPTTVLLNITMLQGLLGLPLVLGVSWTLGIELLFYAQQAAAARWGRLEQAVHAGWVWLAVFVLFAAVTRVTGSDTPLALPLMLYTASLGQAVYQYDQGRPSPLLPLLLAGVVVEPLGSALGVLGTPGDWYASGYATSYLLGLLLFGAFWALRRREVPRPLVLLGTWSYALYLAHPFVVSASRRLYGHQDWLLVAVQPLLAIAAAAVLYRVVEAPTIALGRRLSARRPTRASAPSAP